MKKPGAILLSFVLIFMMTVTNLAGAYHTAGRVYAAEETDGGAENSEGGTQGGEGAASTNDVLPTEDTSGSGDPSTQVTPPQNPAHSNTADPAIMQPQGSVPSSQDVNFQQGINPQQGNLSAQDVIPSQPDSSLTQQENNSQATIVTVTFDANGHGVAPAPVTVESGQTVAKPDDLTADGFTFTGWFRDAAATTAWNFDIDTITNNITLYAGWTENAPQTQQNTMQQPDDTLQQSQNSGNGENGSTAALQNTPTPATTYTVTFDANGHGTAPDAVTVNEGDTISEPVAPTEDGWTFTGWFLDREATIAWDFNNDTVTDHTTLYAGWEGNTPAPTRSGMLRNGGTKAEIPPTKITINIEIISQSGDDGDWRVGDKGRATVTVTPENASKDVIWEADPEGIVEIDKDGYFTIIKQHEHSRFIPGTIIVISRVDDSAYSRQIGRLVPADSNYWSNAIEAVEISECPNADGMWREGNEGQASVRWKSGVTPRTVTWSASHIEAVDIEIDSDGKFRVTRMDSYAQQNLYITATFNVNGVDYSCRSDVIKAFKDKKNVTAVRLIKSPTKLSYVIGEKFDYTGLEVELTYDDGTTGTSVNGEGFHYQPGKDGDWWGPRNTPFQYGDNRVAITYTPYYGDSGTGTIIFNIQVSIPPTYTVSVTNDGNGTGEANPTSGTQGTEVTLTATPNNGYKFDRWFVSNANGGTLSGVTDNPAIFTIGTGNATIRASFAEDPNYQYVITYHLDGGTNNAGNPATYTKSDTITLADPKKDGFTFDGWYDNASFSGSPVTGIPVNSTGDKTFWAKWTAETYAITYNNLNGASNSNPTTYTIADTPITLASPTGATGYTFDGWYDNASFSGSPVTGIPANSTGDKTFYAKWNIIRSVKVTDDGNGSGEANPTSGTEGTVVTLTASPNSGFAFEKWEVVSGGVTVSNNKFTIGTADVEVKAIFESIPANTYSVTVTNDGNGTGTADPTYGAQGTSVTLTATPNSGYEFDQWVVDTSGNGVLSGVNGNTAIFTIGDGSAKIKATFKKIYSVTVNTDGNGTASATPTEATAGKIITVTATPNNDYEIDTITYQPEGGNETNITSTKSFTMPAKNVSVTVKFKPVTVTGISIDTPGKTDYKVNEMLDVSGMKIRVEKSDGTHEIIPVTAGMVSGFDSTTATQSKTLTITYEGQQTTYTIRVSDNTPTTYSITLDANGGKVNGKSMDTATTGTDGKLSTLPTPTHTNTNMSFLGWFTSASGGTAVSTSTVFTGNDTIYAQWQDNTPTTFTITLDANGGTVNGKTTDTATTGTDGKLSTLPTPTHTNTNMSFLGWFTAASGGTAVDTNTVFTGNDTIYAQWQDNTPTTFTITLDANGGTVNGKSTDTAITGTDGKLATLPTPTHMNTNMSFLGWYTAVSGGTAVNTSTVFTGNDTIYAQWKDISQPAATYTITLNANGGTVNGKATDTATTGTDGKLSTLPTPTHTNTNMSFLGWYTAASGGTAVNTSTVFTGNDTIYAQWKDTTKPPVTYTITFNPNGGTVTPTSGTTDANGKLATLPTPTHSNSNMQFIGWFTAKTGGTQVNTSTVFRSNSTIYAQWKDNTPTTQIRTVTTGLTGGVPGTKFTTKEQVEDELLLRVGVNRTTANGRWASYDVKLQVYINGQWIDADKSNFPSGGLTVTLPYPSGTGRNTHTFKVAHMFTVAMNGHQPGQVETPPVTNTDKGIQVTLQGLSPVVITWEEKQGGNPSNPGGGGSSGGSSGSGTYTPAPVPQIKPNFDSKYYADTYPDLKEAFGYDHDALWNHYVLFGKNEGRKVRFILNINKFQEGIFNYADRWQMDDVMLRAKIPTSAYFDTDAYADLYPDLKAAFGYDHELLYRHYLEYGRYEGRKVYTRNIFNAKAYADRYADLKKVYGYDKVALWRHYQLHGKAERRYVEWLEEEEADKDTK